MFKFPFPSQKDGRGHFKYHSFSNVGVFYFSTTDAGNDDAESDDLSV